jgi:hypothetical protein
MQPLSTSQKCLLQASGSLIAGILLIGVTINTPKPLRLLPLGLLLSAAATAATVAHRGIEPAEDDARNLAAERACKEAELEDALVDMQEANDLERRTIALQQQLHIEAQYMRETLPTQVELRKMEEILNPRPVLMATAAAPQIPQLGGDEPAAIAPGPTLPLFDWERLKDADRHPILAMIAKMGGGKSILVKWLGKHILSGQITVFDVYSSKQSWKGCKVLFDFEDMIREMAVDNLGIKDDVAAFRDGKRDFPSRLMVLEEGKSTMVRLQKLRPSRELIDELKELDSPTNPARIVEEWRLNYESLTRKIRRRLCLVSTNMNAEILGINAETRDEITLIFPGTQGIAKAFKDTSMLKLGAKQNAALRDTLARSLQGIAHPALIYHDGEWFPAQVPELNEDGDPVGTVPKSQPQPKSERQQLEDMWNMEPGDRSHD